MQVRYIAVWKLHGANRLGTEESTRALTEVAEPRVCASLTTDPEPYLRQIDTGLAIGGLLLKGVFAPRAESTPEERLAAEIDEIRAARSKRLGSGVFIVFEGDLEIPEPDFRVRRDTDTYAICFDAIDKPEVRETFRPFKQAVLTALGLNLPGQADRRVEQAGEVIYLIDPDGKPIYSFTATGGTARASVASPLGEEVAAAAARHAPKIAADSALAKPAGLLVTSLDQARDGLEAFIAAWSALEIFINATFKATYQERWFAIMEDGAPASGKPVFERLREVMKDKYRLADKFLIIASVLDPDGADADAGAFREVKGTRDKLFHAVEVPQELPTEAIQQLLLKYMKLHLDL